MTLHDIMLEVCKRLLRDLRIRLGLDPIHGAMVADGIYDGMEE